MSQFKSCFLLLFYKLMCVIHVDVIIEYKNAHKPPSPPLQINLQTGTMLQVDKDTVYDHTLLAWTTEH